MNAGELDRRILFQERTETQDSASGAYTYEWTDRAEVWAKVIEETRPENVAGDISMAARPANMFIRWRDDITSDMRVIYGDRTMEIVAGPAEVGRREWLKFSAIEFSTQGEDA